ncbi:histidinol-phosphate transaminase [Immundisolibacter sp.]|uniref:histidinol-phosphate transaminase n=1 Tax=Immundisolibacter sp. TaxID=1934948 RepID=UPI00261FC210|nr:histidinol-phosphate transaminase [Immundisolibacter sp.]MDD3650597.1 histidinol-phosphate transaminase [Immundisolibacter sp.]
MSFSVRDLATPGVRALQPYQPGKPLSELEREYGISGAIKLASNENPLGPSPLGLAAAREALAEVELYPDSHGFALKQALSAALRVGADQLVLGNGSNEILQLVARAFLNPGDEVVVAQYAFAIFTTEAVSAGGRVVTVPARDWGADLPAMRAAVGERTRLVFLANPNNPTGTWHRAAELLAFLESLPEHVVVVLDEAYCEYVSEPDYPNGLAWLSRFPNLIVSRTFSKIYGLAGLRLGYGVASVEMADLLNRLREPFSVNNLALAAGVAALADEEHVARSRELNAQGLTQLADACRRLGLDFIPSVGNFIAVDVGRPAGPVYEALLREGIIVRPLAPYGMPRHLRITIGTPQQMQRLLAALPNALAA